MYTYQIGPGDDDNTYAYTILRDDVAVMRQTFQPFQGGYPAIPDQATATRCATAHIAWLQEQEGGTA